MARQLEFTFTDAPESKADRRKRLLAGLLGELFEKRAIYWCEEAAAEAEERVAECETKIKAREEANRE